MLQCEITGCSTASLYPMQVETALDALIEMGCRTVELFINAASELTSEFVGELRRRADDAGVTVTSIHPYTSAMEGMLLFSDYERRTEEGFALYRRYMEAAAALGARYVVIHGAYAVTADNRSLRHAQGISDEDYYRRMGRLYRMGQQLGAVPAQENVYRHRSGAPAFIRGMRGYLGEQCAFVLDLKQCRLSGVTAAEMIDAMGPQLSHIHLSDGDAANPCMLPGTGDLDLVKFRQELQGRNYRGRLVTEVYRNAFTDIQELADSLTHVRKCFS